MTIDEPGNARSRRTRTALLDATREILEERGFDALTMGDVADRAGVTRRAVYLHFSSVSALVAALFDHVAETEGLPASVQRVFDAPDAVRALEAWARHLAEYHPRVMAVDQAVQRVERVNADAAAHRARVSAAQADTCRHVATRLHDEGRLAAGWTVDTATDALYGLIATELFIRLIDHRGWTQEQLADGLARLLRSTLVAVGAAERAGDAPAGA